MNTKDFAEIQVDELIECVRKFENGRATNDSLLLHRKNMVLAIRARVPSPHTEDFLTVRDEFAKGSMALYFGNLAKRVDRVRPEEYREAATNCFRDASAMIEARKAVTP